MSKLFYYDLETTGTDPRMHSVHQISAIIEIDGDIKEEVDIKVCPHPKARIEPEALHTCGVTKDQILAYQPMKSGYKALIKVLEKYVDKFDTKDKFHQVGFNNRGFDDPFLRKWFIHNGDQFIGSWFWTDSWDALVLASWYLRDRRAEMPTFKLKRVALEMGIDFDPDKLHDGVEDVRVTRKIFRIATGIDLEL